MGGSARRAFAIQLGRIKRLEGTVRSGHDPEALHRMRVAVRRARAALRVFAPFVDPALREDAARDLRRLGRALGPARDADILLGHFERRLARQPEGIRRALAPLHRELRRRRASHYREMVRFLSGRKFARAREGLEALADPGRWPPGAARPLAMEATGLVRPRFAEARACLAPVATTQADVEALHALRIALKEARYALEFTLPAFPPEARDLLKGLRNLQDRLGAIQDGVIEEAEVRAAADDVRLAPGAQAALGAYLQAARTERSSRLSAVPDLLAQARRDIARARRLVPK